MLTLAQRTDHVHVNGSTARTDAHNRDGRTVAAEMSNVLLDPSQCHHLIFQSEITGRSRIAGREESERSQAISDGDKNDSARVHKIFGTGHGRTGTARKEGAAMNVNDYRQRVVVAMVTMVPVRSVHVQVETVLYAGNR